MRPEDSQFVEFAGGVSPGLLRRARLLTGDAQLAEDLVQTTLLKLYVRWRHERRWDSPEAYAQRVLYTSFCAWHRRRWSGEIPTAHFADRASADPPSTDEALAAALQALPRRQRAVVVARFYDDLSVEQTAQLLGCSPGTVKSQTARALDKLRAALAVRILPIETLEQR